MNKLVKRGKDADSIPNSVLQVLSQNKEVLIITANPCQGESNIAVYTKLLDDNGVLANTLVEILTNIMLTANRNGKCTT